MFRNMKIEDFKHCVNCLHNPYGYCDHPRPAHSGNYACKTTGLEYYKPKKKLLKKFYKLNNPSLFKRILIKIFKLQ